MRRVFEGTERTGNVRIIYMCIEINKCMTEVVLETVIWALNSSRNE